MTSFDIAVLTQEFDETIRGARIANIYQINSATLLLELRQPGQPRIQLLIEVGKGLRLTSYIIKKPKKPPAFCMALRKHLRNGEIAGVQQHEFERIVTVMVTTREGEYQFVSELFGEGNIILVSPENKILHALRYRRMRDRNVLPGEMFQHAPPSGKNPLILTRLDFGEIKRLGRLEIVRALTRFLSIGGLYAEEILLRAQVGKDVQIETITEQEIDRIFTQLHRILSNIKSGNIEPRVVINEKGEWVDVVPFSLKKFASFKQKMYESFNEALDEYYTEATVKERVIEASREVKRKVARQKRILQSQLKALKESRKKMEQKRRIGDAIFSHLGELQLLRKEITRKKREGKPWDQIALDIEKERNANRVPAVYFYSLDPNRLTFHVLVEDLVFPLNFRLSIQANAENYYTKAKRSERKLKGIEKAIRETQIRIQGLQEVWEEVPKTRKTPIKRRKRTWYEKFRWFYSSDDFLVIGGRDATTNEILIKKHMEPHDIVFHADIHGAPFVLIKTGGKTPPEQTIKEAAILAASYSRGWREMFATVNVYWVSPQQISKYSRPGLRLSRGAFLISGSKNYVRNVPLRVTIGIKVKEEQPIIIGGPLEAISKQTNTYVEIVPGGQTSRKIAKQIQHLLAKKSEALRRQILEIPLEEIQRFIPLGKGKVIG